MMRKALLVAVVAILVVATSVPAVAKGTSGAERFKDLPPSNWANSSIMQAVNKGYVNGFEDGTFKPSNSVTRAELIKMLVDALQLPHGIEGKPWYSPYVAVAIETKLHEEADFSDYTKPVTRLEIMRLVSRGLATSESYSTYLAAFKGLYNGDLPFVDYRELKEKDIPLAALALGSGIVKGYQDQSAGFEKLATRAEAVVMIERMLSQLGRVPEDSQYLRELKEVAETGMNATAVSNLIPMINLISKNVELENYAFKARLKRIYVLPTKGSILSLYERKFLWDRTKLNPLYFEQKRGFVIAVLDLIPKRDGQHSDIWGGKIYLNPNQPFYERTAYKKFGYQIDYAGGPIPMKKDVNYEVALFGGFNDTQYPFNIDPALQGNNLSRGSYTYLLKNPDRKTEE